MLEMKKSAGSAAAPVAGAAKRKSAVEYVGEIKQELKLVDWTAKGELIFYTKIVAGATFVCGMAIYGMDLVLQGVLHAVGFLARLVGG